MLKRRDSLYQRATPSDPEREKAKDKGMYDTLKEQGVTAESLEADIQKYEKRDVTEEMEKARQALEVHFGGDKQAEEAVKSAKGILKRFAKPVDLKFLEDTGLGNDPELIKILVNLDQILKRGGKKK
jgi:hypothetical protein